MSLKTFQDIHFICLCSNPVLLDLVPGVSPRSDHADPDLAQPPAVPAGHGAGAEDEDGEREPPDLRQGGGGGPGALAAGGQQCQGPEGGPLLVQDPQVPNSAAEET